MSQQILARYYRLPTNGRLSLCTVESGSLSHDYSAIYPAYFSLAHATTRLMVHACAWLVLCEYEHLNILNILMITLYLIFSLLMLELFSLIMKVMNLLRKERTSKIMNNLIQCMLTFHNIKSKIWMSISSKISLGKKNCMVQKHSRWNNLNSFERKSSTLCRWGRY